MASHSFSMNLTDLLTNFVIDEKFDEIIIEGLSLDSRSVIESDMFLATKGDTVNGMEYINDAIDSGARAICWEAEPNVNTIKVNWRKNSAGISIPIIAIENLSQVYGEIADRFYEYPSRQLSVCGITGTNGKTSCADFIAQVMSVDKPCGLMGTLGSGLYPLISETGYTTPDAITCHRWLADMQKQQATFAVMEVSSHALTLGRVSGIHFDSAIFTNISRDHLDFHGDMQSYIAAKSKLFQVNGLKNAIINVDDEIGRKIAEELASDTRCLRYGIVASNQPDIYGTDIQLDHRGLSMKVITPWGEGQFTAAVMGKFNASNLLAVLAIMLVQGIELDEALQRLSKIHSVAGRMQSFGCDKTPLVVVDFAHTPDALEQALTSLRQHTKGDLWCVFGCGGDRDQGKRALMGAVAQAQADKIVLTNDNPRSENAEKIVTDIKSGMNKFEKVLIELDRHIAIHTAIQQAKAGDVVLVAGKGHEKYQIIGEEKYSFSDIDEVKKQLEECA